MTNLLKAALNYAAHGWAIFPCETQGKKPIHAGKFETQASRDPEVIRQWWTVNPTANIGLPTGPLNGLWVLDVDGIKGNESLNRLMKEHGHFDALYSETGGGGFHFVFSWPDEGPAIRNSAGKLAAGLDVRGLGGFIVAPPSTHASGRAYEWAYEDITPTPAPDWLLTMVQSLQDDPPPKPPATLPPPIPIVKTDNPRVSAYLEGALQQAAHEVATAPKGTRNDALNREAFNVGQLVGAGALAEGTARAILTTAARQAGLPAGEIAKSLNSGLTNGKAKPRDVSARLQATAYTPPPQPLTTTIPTVASPSQPDEGTLRPLTLQSINGKDLLTMTFPPMRWAVDGLIPEGLSLLAGRPKSGKSWLAFQLGIAIATGGEFLGKPCEMGQVLFLGLEDQPRRLQSRLLKQLGNTTPQGLENIAILCDIPQADQGGLTMLEQWLEEHPATRLIVLDTMGRFLPSEGKGDAYGHTTAYLGALQKMAFERGACLLVIHHTKKKGSDKASFEEEDFTESVLGSTGIVGACDAVLVLERPRMQDIAALRLTGRDVVEKTTTLQFQEASCTWSLSDQPIPATSGSVEGATKALVRATLERVGEASPKELFEATGLPHGQYEAVKKALQRMAETGEVLKPNMGIYRSVSYVSPMSLEA